MGQVCQIGLDIAKEYFQVHGVDKNGKDVFNKKLKKKNVLSFFANLPPCLVGLEACGGAHYWARKIAKLDAGHTVKLISPRHVKPFVLNNKTDAADARAICEVAGRPSTRFVAAKTVEQQDLAAWHKIREKKSRSAQHWRIRRGRSCWNNDEACKRLRRYRDLARFLPVAHAGDATEYKNGRGFAVSLGLTPKEHSSEGKQKLPGISKRGSNTIRKLLIQGARIITRYALAGEDKGYPVQKWIQGVATRRGRKIAAVALANKTARIIWNLLEKKEEYRPVMA